ncbi:MAG: acetyl-CoA C-acyltransferase family protein [Holophaga sp.]|nr:acetyl-CoA C-acyltransferase family protein [Holophaga sp.]
MSIKRDILVLSAVRTAIGDFNGGLKDFSPTDLGQRVVTEAIARAGVDPDAVDQGFLGHIIHTEPKDLYVSRVSCLLGGMGIHSKAMSVNRLCGSGLQAIVSAAQQIELGESEITLGGGVESMTRGGYLMPAARWGARMGDTRLLDMMVGALTDPFGGKHMGITAENLAVKWAITREEQDAFAVESHRRAALAISEGRFKSQIIPIEHISRKGTVIFDQDEHVRPGVTMADLAKLKPAFLPEGGTVTAGNASSINDGGAALVLAEAGAAARFDTRPLARVVGWGIGGVDPNFMGEGPIPAVKAAIASSGLRIADMDVIEGNEAFAAQALTVSKALEFDPAKVNPNGGAIALGHPIGASGAILVVKAIYELHRTGGRYALVTLCIGGGQGIAAVFERV